MLPESKSFIAIIKKNILRVSNGNLWLDAQIGAHRFIRRDK